MTKREDEGKRMNTEVGVEDAEILLAVRFFGSCQISRNGSPLPLPRVRKVLVLLALLILRAGKPVDRSFLSGTLWPDSDQGGGAMNLRRTLSDLRAWLGPDAARLESPTRQTVSFQLDRVFVDVTAFDKAAARWEKRGDISAAEEAVALYRGPLFEGWEDLVLLGERERRARLCLEMLEALGRYALAESDVERALRLARRAEQIDNLSQPVLRLLLEALTARGDVAAMLRTYRDFRIRLYDEGRMEPDRETVALVERLRFLPPNTGSRQESVEPASLDTPLLPLFLTPFIGRSDEITAIVACYSEPAIRLLTLTGIGGIGKTRLAVAVAERIGHGFFVDLAALPRAADEVALYETILRAVAPESAPAEKTARQAIKERLAGMEAFLVLDNAEHLIPAISHVVETLLRDIQDCRILVTSRVSLAIPAESQWSVTPFSEREAVALFEQRARAVRRDFNVTPENREIVSALCRNVECIPLAVELAAARLRVLALETILARLSNRLSLLAVDSPTLPERQRTMRGTLEWSYGLLSRAEQTLLRALSVFSGGWTLEAAEEVCGLGEQTLDVLTKLVESSLVIAAERFHLLEITLAFVSEKQKEDENERKDLERRHYRYFLRLGQEANSRIWGENSRLVTERLERERENLHAAILRAPGAEALELCTELANYWFQGGHFREGLRLLEYAQRKCEQESSVVPALTLAKGRSWVGRFKRSLGEAQDALIAFTEGLALARETGAHDLLMSILLGLGAIYHEQIQITEARRCYDEGSARCLAIGDTVHAALFERDSGILYCWEGDYASARQQFEKALVSVRANRLRWDEMTALWWLGFASEGLGEYPAAIDHFKECHTLAVELKSPYMELASLQSMADVARDRGDFAEALERYEATLPYARQVGAWYKQAVAWRGMSEASRGLGDIDAARDCCRQALQMAIRANAPLIVALELLSEASAVRMIAGDREAAVKLYSFIENVRQSRKVATPAAVRKRHTADISCLRSTVEESLFQRLWEEGERMTLSDAYTLCD